MKGWRKGRKQETKTQEYFVGFLRANDEMAMKVYI